MLGIDILIGLPCPSVACIWDIPSGHIELSSEYCTHNRQDGHKPPQKRCPRSWSRQRTHFPYHWNLDWLSSTFSANMKLLLFNFYSDYICQSINTTSIVRTIEQEPIRLPVLSNISFCGFKVRQSCQMIAMHRTWCLKLRYTPLTFCTLHISQPEKNPPNVSAGIHPIFIWLDKKIMQ